MKRLIPLALVACTLLAASPVAAEICAIDAVPAATLLVPYFEVDLGNPNGINTLFSINNASATAILAHVVFWTNFSAPTIDFDIYLTGYDVQTVNLREVFAGNLPITASAGQDPGDLISNQGFLSQDINFASCNNILPFVNPVVRNNALDRLVNGHLGEPVASLAGRCLGDSQFDEIARGYITVDTVNQCSLVLDLGDPGAGYFLPGGTGIATNQNVLWGDLFYINPGENFAQGETLVHIEADPLMSTNPDNQTGYTFYGRYTAPTGADQREPLGTTWATRFLNGGAFDGGTDLIVWRDSTVDDVLPAGVFCGSGPSWFPLNETDVVAFDEQENPADLCSFEGSVISPPEDDDPACFPYETGRYSVGEGDLDVPTAFGWLYLNLNHTAAGGAPAPPLAQSYVMAVHDADGRFSVGLEAIELSSACSFTNNLLIP